jgi:hypothetical protein
MHTNAESSALVRTELPTKWNEEGFFEALSNV